MLLFWLSLLVMQGKAECNNVNMDFCDMIDYQTTGTIEDDRRADRMYGALIQVGDSKPSRRVRFC